MSILRTLSGVALVAVMVLVAAPASAANSQAAVKKQELAKVKRRIAAVKKALDKAVAQRGRLTTELRHIETKLGKAEASLDAVNTSIQNAHKKIATIEHQQDREQAKLDREKHALAQQVRAAYIAGGHNRLKLLLNQQNPAQVQRMLGYYDYFNRARVSKVRTFNHHLKRLQTLQDAHQKQLSHLADLKHTRQQARNTIKQHRNTRRQLLVRVNGNIKKKNTQLATLKRSRRQLKQLIARLTDALADIPKGLDSYNFRSLRKQLKWPVAGRHIAHYGAPRIKDKLRWEGVMIAAKAGTPVHAIAHGRVIYAGWLPRFGELLIIDHGGGYMSVYAHNQSLYKAVGDWVNAGDTVASVGRSGGQTRSALFFQIRHHKTPVNPNIWCR